jgi:hypothetical protein
MPEIKNLNVAPYFDDFSEEGNFVKTLFRPGFAIQARELTQLQTVLQNQIERHGSHIFKEGAMVIPGQMLAHRIATLKLAATFSGETIDVAQYFNADTPVTITGATTGVTAKVVGFTAGSSTDQPLLHVSYQGTGSDFETFEFADGENISADAGISHTTSYAVNTASATTFTSLLNIATATAAELASSIGPASRRGKAVQIESGVYYVRGFFIQNNEEILILDPYGEEPSFLVGFSVTETLVTPEEDTSLLDNSTGSTNFSAKGAHRLKINLSLTKLPRGTVTDENFIQLMDILDGRIRALTEFTAHSELEQTLARRTHDESGDYTVKPFEFEVFESVTINENVGRFALGATTEEGNTASTDLLALKVSTGKAYIKGIETSIIAPSLLDITKSRDFNSINAGITTAELGNFVNVTNIYGSPDIAVISGETTQFKQVSLFDTATSTRGTAAGTQIGVARARGLEYSQGTVGASSTNVESVYKLYVFDLKMFTQLTLSGTPSPTLIATHTNGGTQVKGASSGATGFVFATGTSGTDVILTSVAGTFQSGEKITASDSAETDDVVEDVDNTDLTITKVETFSFSDTKQTFMEDDDSGEDFTADIVTESDQALELILLEESVDRTEGNLLSEDASGDQPAGNEDFSIERIFKAKLKQPEKNLLVYKGPKKVIKTHLTTTNSGLSDTQYTVRKQFVGTTVANAVTFNAGAGETFVTHAEKDYTLSILTANGGASQGDVVSIASTISGAGTAAITITDATDLPTGTKVKLIGTILKTSVNQKNKTVQLMKKLEVNPGDTDAFGTRPTDRTISLGRADVFKLVAVLDSEETSTSVTMPSLTLGTITGSFTRGERIIGSVTGAEGRIVNISSPIEYVLTSTLDFSTNDVITGQSSGASSSVTAVTAGSENITSNYILDTGQRDNFYDIARIVRKQNVSSPTGKVIVVYDYFEHGTGDVFTVDSYVDIADQMTYEDIPTYSATKIDPDAPVPTGEFPLIDCYDFRPRVEDIAGTSATLTTTDEVTGHSFDFFSRQYDGAGSSISNIPKPDSFIQSDFEFYLPKYAIVELTPTKQLIIKEGVGAEFPVLPESSETNMKLATLFLPAFTFFPDDVEIKRERHQRFTMKDIGKIERRLQHVEYYTSLNLLERSAQDLEVTDASGLNRFKSGFVVDNFAGHRTGDVANVDYKCSIDPEKNELRPKHKMQNIGLSEQATTDSQRTSAHYQKTGDIVSLPYTEIVLTEQLVATRVERICPILLSTWRGNIELDPFGDDWFEAEVRPQIIISVAHDFDFAAAIPDNILGSMWNSWQSQWAGIVEVNDVPEEQGGANAFSRSISAARTVGESPSTLGIANMERIGNGFRVVTRGVRPFIRASQIKFTGDGFRPNTRLYTFFDKTAVSSFVTMTNAFTSESAGEGLTTAAPGSSLITTAAGHVEGFFDIPDPTIAGNPRFATGEIEFRLTSSNTDVRTTDPDTHGNAYYQAKGLFESAVNVSLRLRPPPPPPPPPTPPPPPAPPPAPAQVDPFAGMNRAARQAEVDRRQRLIDGARREAAGDGDDGDDPLAMTFTPISINDFFSEISGGCFLTSLDIFFSAKDENIPVTLEIRTTDNGYPGKDVLPFGRVVKQAADIIPDLTGETPTTFIFPSLVYLQSDIEYCMVLLTNTGEHKVWISRLGETPIGGGPTLSEQPHLGALFKGHNNTAWAMSGEEDMKFRLKRADFDTSSGGVLTLENDPLPSKRLKANPLTFTHGDTALKVTHKDHGMYNIANNVTIAGVSSGLSTTLSAAITSTATTLTLISGTNFNKTTGKFANTVDSTPRFYIKIDDEIMYYETISGTSVSTLVRAQESTTAAAHSAGAIVEFFQLHKVPLSQVNTTHTAIANIDLDSYSVLLTSSPAFDGGAGSSAENGGNVVTATENHIINTGFTQISTLAPEGTRITSVVRTTTGTSVSGSETSFTKTTAANAIGATLNDNIEFDTTFMIASSINETNEMSDAKSYETDIILSSSQSNLSPVIDTKRVSWVSVANRINNIDSSSDLASNLTFVASTEPEGDNNAAIYVTKKVVLENPATAIKVLLTAHRPATSEIKVMFKVLGAQDSVDFDDLDYEFFNTDGSADQFVNPSLDQDDFQEYVFSSGVTDDGIGTPLDEYISFAIKIVMQGTNMSEPPRIKDLRALALAL